MRADIDRVKLLVFFAGLTLFYAVESLRPLRSWETSRRRRWATHTTLAVFNSAVIRLLVAAPLFAWVQFVQDHGWGLWRTFGFAGNYVNLLASITAFDCYDYWWHRYNHRVPFLWRFHRVHHLDTHVDVTTSLRFHFGELVLSGLAKAAWILVWGPGFWTFAVCEASVTAASQFHHSNFDFPDAWESMLRRYIMTPRVHTAHHTVTLRTRDANYSTILSVWDRLFRTFKKPNPAESRALGLPEDRETYLAPQTLLFSPFI